MSVSKSIEMVTSKSEIGRQLINIDEDDDDDESIDEKLVEEELSATLLGDLLKSVYHARFTAPLLIVLSIVFTYQLVIAPYRTNETGGIDASDLNNLKSVRPMPSDETLKQIQGIMLRQDNLIDFPEEEGGSFNMRFVESVNKHGTHDLPDMFYEGVMFGISHGNSHKVEYSRVQPDLSYNSLFNDLTNMKPTPTHILKRTATCNNTDWTERGFGVYFSYADLKKQGMLSSDAAQPWKRVSDDMLWTARKYKQIYMMIWYPHRFGAAENLPGSGSNHKHENIIQVVMPTRTGMDGLKSTTAVWLMARNETEVTIPPRMVRVNPRTGEIERVVSAESF